MGDEDKKKDVELLVGKLFGYIFVFLGFLFILFWILGALGPTEPVEPGH